MIPPPPRSTLFPYTTLFRTIPARNLRSEGVNAFGGIALIFVATRLPRPTGGLLAPYQTWFVKLVGNPTYAADQVGTGLVVRATGAMALTVNLFLGLPRTPGDDHIL